MPLHAQLHHTLCFVTQVAPCVPGRQSASNPGYILPHEGAGHPASPLQGSSFQLVLPAGNEIKISQQTTALLLLAISHINDPVAIPPFLSFCFLSPHDKVRSGTGNTLSCCWPSPQQGCFPCLHFQDFLSPQEAKCTLLEVVLRNQMNLNQQPENQLKISNRSL